MRKSLHLITEFWPRKWPCFAVGFVSSGNECALRRIEELESER
jgi:hypothetical protein